MLPLSQVEVPPEESADAITIASVATVSFGPVDLLLKSNLLANLLWRSNPTATQSGCGAVVDDRPRSDDGLLSTHGEPLVEVQSDVADLLSKSNLMATTRGHSPNRHGRSGSGPTKNPYSSVTQVRPSWGDRPSDDSSHGEPLVEVQSHGDCSST